MKHSLKKNIMSKIEDDSIKMKPQNYYKIKKVGLKFSFVFIFLVITFFVNLIFLFLERNDLVPILHHRSGFWHDFFHFFPYELVVLIIFIVFLFLYTIKQFDFFLSYSYAFIFLILASTIIVIALAMTMGGMNTFLHKHMKRADFNMPYLSNFYSVRCHID